MTRTRDAEWQATLYRAWRKRRGWVLDEQVAMADVPAPTGYESDRANHLQRRLTHITGLPVTRDAVGNVCAVITPPTADAAGRPPLVCLAHLDTVYTVTPPTPMRREGLTVFGAGIGDNGRGLAALLTVAHALQAPSIRQRLVRPVHLVATVGEEGEGNLRGARHWFDEAAARDLVPHAALAIDGPGDESVVHHAVGSVRLRLAMRGPGGHSWVHPDVANPLHALGALAVRVGALHTTWRARAGERTTVQVTRMHGGESLTAVPQHGWLDVDVRSSSNATLTRMRRELTRLTHEVAHEATHAATHAAAHAHHSAPALTAEVTVLGERPAGALPAEHPLVRLAVTCTEQVGRAARAASASTDANVPLALGIPAIAIGAGGTGGAAHTADEWYCDEQSEVGLERVLRLVTALAS